MDKISWWCQVRVWDCVLICVRTQFLWAESCPSRLCSFSSLSCACKLLINHNKDFILNFQVTQLILSWDLRVNCYCPPAIPYSDPSWFIIHVQTIPVWHPQISWTFGSLSVLHSRHLKKKRGGHLKWSSLSFGITAYLMDYVFSL